MCRFEIMRRWPGETGYVSYLAYAYSFTRMMSAGPGVQKIQVTESKEFRILHHSRSG
ncbi:hypothetical protein DSECCO2_08370 [anaerobic digester metagenome]